MARRVGVLIGAFSVMALLLTSGPAAARPPGQACVVIDTDFDIDDMMAIPLIVRQRHVAAIVTTEGATTAPLGASAAVRLLAATGLERPIPVIVGASAAPDRGYTPASWLMQVRQDMERLNGLLQTPITPAAADHPFERDVALAVNHCSSVTVLALGPWTSFARYSPLLAHRITAVVAQGRPAHSNAEAAGTSSFNCAYDAPSCKTAFMQMAGMHPVWVDVPKAANPPYSPTFEMVDGLKQDGLPGSLRAALMSNETSWRTDRLDPAFGKSFLWDQLAALYVLRPDLYHTVGGHMEPSAPAAQFQAIWTAGINGP